MAGFGLNGYTNRIPCPHCGSLDCAGINDKNELICIHTNKKVTLSQLKKQIKVGTISAFILTGEVRDGN